MESFLDNQILGSSDQKVNKGGGGGGGEGQGNATAVEVRVSTKRNSYAKEYFTN